jgi:hypothetical protein
VEAKLGFLIEGIELRCWFHEPLELIRKLILSGLVIFVAPGTTSQVAFALLVCLIALVAHVELKAFEDDSADTLQTLALCQLALLLFGGLLIKTESTVKDGYDLDAFGIVLALCTWGVILCGVVIIFIQFPLAEAIKKLTKAGDSDSDGVDSDSQQRQRAASTSMRHRLHSSFTSDAQCWLADLNAGGEVELTEYDPENMLQPNPLQQTADTSLPPPPDECDDQGDDQDTNSDDDHNDVEAEMFDTNDGAAPSSAPIKTDPKCSLQ